MLLKDRLIEFIIANKYIFFCDNVRNIFFYKGFKFSIKNNNIIIEYIPVVEIDLKTQITNYLNITKNFFELYEYLDYDFFKVIDFQKNILRSKKENDIFTLKLYPIYLVLDKYGEENILPRFKHKIIKFKRNRNECIKS